jgi:DNA-binding transcriptional LysR family regulator
LLPHYIGRKDAQLRLCSLQPVFPSREIYLLMRRQDRKDLPVRTVVEHLERVFADERDLFVD